MKKLIFISSMIFAGNAMAAAGDSTVTAGYLQAKSNGLENQYRLAEGELNAIGRNASALYGASYKVSSDGYSDPKGFFVRYRYEITDDFGVIGSLSYAQQSGSVSGQISNAVINSHGKLNIKGQFLTAMVGPTFRANEYFSVYAMAGISHKNLRESYYGVDQVGYTVTETTMRSNDKKNSLAYGLGAQFNVYKGVTIDAAYEGSNGGDWKTNGFTVGVGYKF